MRGYTIKSQRIYSAKGIVRCRVCGRRPRKNRLVYEITSSIPATVPSHKGGAYIFHDGYTDTMKCALNIVLAGK